MNRLLYVLGLTAVTLAGCGPARDERMIWVPPPSGWEARLLADRTDKDRMFLEDPETPLLPEDRVSFQHLDYWSPQPRYRFVGPLHVYTTRERFQIPTTSGKLRPCEKYGWMSFELEGDPFTLLVYRLLDGVASDQENELFLPFTDETTGKETYPAGRYLNLDGEAGGLYVLDFNRAYNPLCAYGEPERYVCPVTPEENRLPVPIEAGERGFKKMGKGQRS